MDDAADSSMRTQSPILEEFRARKLQQKVNKKNKRVDEMYAELAASIFEVSIASVQSETFDVAEAIAALKVKVEAERKKRIELELKARQEEEMEARLAQERERLAREAREEAEKRASDEREKEANDRKRKRDDEVRKQKESLEKEHKRQIDKLEKERAAYVVKLETLEKQLHERQEETIEEQSLKEAELVIMSNEIEGAATANEGMKSTIKELQAKINELEQEKQTLAEQAEAAAKCRRLVEFEEAESEARPRKRSRYSLYDGKPSHLPLLMLPCHSS
jgi:chromosome segregation ATPase